VEVQIYSHVHSVEEKHRNDIIAVLLSHQIWNHLVAQDQDRPEDVIVPQQARLIGLDEA
jgi:hypothetical protein